MNHKIRIEMVSTGDEVLYGQITDTNAAWLSDFLFQEGFLITSRYTVGDDLTQLITTLQSRSKVNDIIIFNGGLGPTSDDLTAQAAATANQEELVLHQEWVDEMERYFSTRGKTMPPANMKQAMLPKSAYIVDNPVGTACGFKMVINGCVIFFTPGVPSEFRAMMRNQILPAIKSQFPQDVQPICYRLTTMGRSESDLATEIDAKLSVPADISVGYRSAMPIIELKLTGNTHNQTAMDELWQQLKVLVNDNTLYEGATSLVKVVSELLAEQSQPLIIIEQQTAGLMTYQLLGADAPLIKSEIITGQINMQQYIQQLRQMHDNAIFLSLYDFECDNSHFKLILATPANTYIYQLKYTSRKHNKLTEQAIFSAIGYDALRRYLTNNPILVGPNIWLEVVDKQSD